MKVLDKIHMDLKSACERIDKEVVVKEVAIEVCLNAMDQEMADDMESVENAVDAAVGAILDGTNDTVAVILELRANMMMDEFDAKYFPEPVDKTYSMM